MKKKLIISFGWIVSAFLFYLLIKNINLENFISHLKNIKIIPIVLAIILNFTVILLKVVRWYYLTPVNHRASFKATFMATMVGLTGNNLFPARAGDLVKIVMLNRSSTMSKFGLTTLTGLERIFDVAMFITIAALLLITLPTPEWFGAGFKILVLIFVLSIIISVLILIFAERDILPKKLKSICDRMASGLEILKNVKSVIANYLLSIPISLIQILTIILCQNAFEISVPIAASLLVFIAINVAIIIPSAPSNLGSFEFATVIAYSVFSLNSAAALNIALIYHAIQVIPVTIVGLLLIGKNNIQLFKRIENSADSALFNS